MRPLPIALGLSLPTVLAGQSADSVNHLSLEAYASINYQHYAWETDPSRPAALDLERFVVELAYRPTPRLRFEAEVEFEHGGTGTALEPDPSSPGGAGTTAQVEKSGEIIIEELHVTYALAPWLDVRAGHFYVPIGWMSSKYRPFEYLTVLRPEMELALVPAQWDETGVKLMARRHSWRAQLGAVTGLDNSAFGSATWIRNGKQGRFEQARAENLAAVARVDLLPLSGLTLGVSGYTGNTSGNRPDTSLTVPARVTIFDTHADFERAGWRVRGLFLYGWLQNSAAVSAANLGISNAGPVGAAAMGWSFEAGYDLLRLLGRAPTSAIAPRLDCFGRYEFYDSMHRVAGGTVPDPRYARRQWTVGANLRMNRFLVLKTEYADRWARVSSRSHERTVSAGVGAQF